MTGFVQLIEWDTSRLEEALEFMDRWGQEHEQMGPSRVSVCADRDRPGHYVTMVEFGSYEEAMANSEDPETQRFSARMTELCDGPPTFRDLDQIRSVVRMPSGRSMTTA